MSQMVKPMINDIDTNRPILPTAIPVSDQAKIDKKSHSVIILASGLSQRLGQSKQLLIKHGQPLINCMIKIALATKPHAVIVVIPQHQPIIADAINQLALQNNIIYSVVNLIPKMGMAHSLSLGIEALVGLKQSSINRVIIMGVDQVLLDSEHLTELLAAKSSVVASGYRYLDETYSMNRNRENIIGLPIAINVERLKQWQSELTGDKGLRHLIRALPFDQLSIVTNHQLSYDIDTPKQLFYARQQGWLDS